jgi:hypothetical protein
LQRGNPLACREIVSSPFGLLAKTHDLLCIIHVNISSSSPITKPILATKQAGKSSDLYHVVAGIPLKRKTILGKKKPAASHGRLGFI